MKYFNTSMLILSGCALLLTSCDDKDPVIPNEEELITTVIFTLSPVAGGADVEFRFTDLDGDGGDPPVVTNGVVDKHTSYNGTLTLLNEAVSPADDITSEIEMEGTEHQFFFSSGGGLNLIVNYDDMDDDGKPIGLSTLVTAHDASTGPLTIILRHEPDKSAAGVSTGNIDNAGGETDIEVVFDVVIE